MADFGVALRGAEAEAPPSRLILRGTFIDLSSDDAAGRDDASTGRSRARSAPPAGGQQAPSIFVDEEAYVATLSTKIWHNPRPALGLPAPTLQKPRSAEGTIDGGDDQATMTPTTTITTLGTLPGPSASLKSSWQDSEDEDMTVPLNEGSIGHPQICARPCMYFATGKCAKADSCEFCHMPHPKRPAHLQKKHRDMIEELPAHAAVAIILSHIKKRVRALDASDATQVALDRVVDVSGELPGRSKPWNVAADRAAFIKRSLNSVFGSISLRLLVITFQRLVASTNAEAGDAAEALLLRMREAATPLLAL